MMSFTTRQSGLDWFRDPFLSYTSEEERDIHGVLQGCFLPIPLWTRLTTGKSGVRMAAYQPKLVAQ